MLPALARRATVLLLVPLAALGGCKRKQAAFAPPPPPEVTVARPVLATIPDTLESTGTVRAKETVEVRARVKGFLQEKRVDGGRRVQKGELLFVIDPRTFEAAVKQAEADVAARQAQLNLAEVTLSRVQQAVADRAVAQQEVDKAAAEWNVARAQVAQAQAALDSAKLDLEFTQVRAPISGRMGIVTVDEGQLVGANDATLLATIVNDEQVYVSYNLDEQTLQRLRSEASNRRPGEDGRPQLPIHLGLSNERGYPHKGQFDRADSTVDPATGTLRIEAIFDNKDTTILPGYFARVQAVFGEKQALLVPEVAVLSDQAGRYVLMLDEKDVVQRVPVQITGPVWNRQRPVEEVVGLSLPDQPAPAPRLTPDARVVVNGLQRARPGAPVKPVMAAAQGGAEASASPAPAPRAK